MTPAERAADLDLFFAQTIAGSAKHGPVGIRHAVNALDTLPALDVLRRGLSAAGQLDEEGMRLIRDRMDRIRSGKG